VKNGFALLAVLLAPLVATAEDPEADQLRHSIQVPLAALRAPSLQIRFDWDERGVHVVSDDPDPQSLIADLEQTLGEDPADAEGYHRLAHLYVQVPNLWKGREAIVQAIKLYRRQLQAEPGNGRAMAGLGIALLERGGAIRSGEARVRLAVQTSPNDFRCRQALGRLHLSAAIDVLKSNAPDEPTPGQIQQITVLVREAAACFDEAVRLAPGEPDAYIVRAVFRAEACTLRDRIASFGGDTGGRELDCGLTDQTADLCRAAKLRPDDWRAARVASVARIALLMDREKVDPPDFVSDAFWKSLSGEGRRLYRLALRPLRRILDNGDPASAAGAAETLAIHELAGPHDLATAEGLFRRALQLDPKRERSWDGLLTVLLLKDDAPAIAEVLEQRLTRLGDTRSRLLFAGHCLRQHRPAEAEGVLREVYQHQPDNFPANLGLAAAALETCATNADLARVEHWLDRAETLSAYASETDRIRVCSLRGVFLALSGKPTEGRELLEEALTRDPNNDVASDALRVLRGISHSYAAPEEGR
jgi:tetratricopeptide (TPR) repeat protein